MPISVSDGEYLRHYEHEIQRYAERFAPRPGDQGPGAANLSEGKWAWIDDDLAAAARWARYGDRHGPLRAMNPDGSWRPWQPPGMR